MINKEFSNKNQSIWILKAKVMIETIQFGQKKTTIKLKCVTVHKMFSRGFLDMEFLWKIGNDILRLIEVVSTYLDLNCILYKF